MTSYLLERALLPTGIADDVLVTIEEGRFADVTPGGADPAAVPLAGLTIPGFANCHSHAFHRALRGRTQRGRGTFWTWREQMYDVAARLTPDSYFDLALATYREMVAAGMTSVGEFHYLHNQPDGTTYDDPNEMGLALIEAARQAGIRLTLLDTCYLSSGFGAAPEGPQVRYSDGTADRWAERVAALEEDATTRIGAAIHSVRAVPRDQLATVALHHGPLHVHLSEQRAENTACREQYGVTPTRVLHDAGALTSRTSVVHATHLSDADIALIGGESAYADFCPTTERDLGDGIGPGTRLRDAGARLTLGSDSHAVIDHFEEMRALEMDERLASEQRGHWSARELVDAATVIGHASLGWADAGRIEVGQRADLVTIDTDSPRTAGTGRDEHTAAFAATSADIVQVVVDGEVRFRKGDEHEIGRALKEAVDAL